jgi:hypothetical protein
MMVSLSDVAAISSKSASSGRVSTRYSGLEQRHWLIYCTGRSSIRSRRLDRQA